MSLARKLIKSNRNVEVAALKKKKHESHKKVTKIFLKFAYSWIFSHDRYFRYEFRLENALRGKSFLKIR